MIVKEFREKDHVVVIRDGTYVMAFFHADEVENLEDGYHHKVISDGKVVGTVNGNLTRI